MKNLCVMYHFVADTGDPRSFSTGQFRDQLEFLGKRAQPVSLRELVDKRPSGPTFTITFDDGLKDGYTACLPVLESMGIKASFFVSMAVWDRREILQTQKRQLLLRKLGAEAFAAAFNERVEPMFHVHADGVAKNHLDDLLVSNMKWVMDRMDWDLSQKVIGELFAAHFDEKHEFDRLYLSEREAREMASLGHEIGLHGYSHRRLAELYFNDQRADMERSVAVYERVLGAKPRSISYPFGSYNLFTLRLARHLGVDIGVTTVKRYNVDVARPLELSRFDCIDVYPRQPALPV